MAAGFNQRHSRRISALLTLMVLAGGCDQTATSQTSMTPAPSPPPGSLNTPAALLSYFRSLAGHSKHLLVGQHTDYWDRDPMQTVTPIAANTGRQVAILGTTNDWNGTSNEDGVSLSNDWLAKGGIVLVSQSPQNPLKTSGGTYVDVRTPGTAAYSQWHSYLDAQIAKLKQIKGPVIFRPFIEINGSWSWWPGQNPADFRLVWQQTHDYFASKGVTNVLWLLSLNTEGNAEDAMSWYPGDDYVDLVGIDAYPPSKNDQALYKALVATGKPVMYAEAGVNNPNNSTISRRNFDNSDLLSTLKNKYPAVFALVIWCQNYALPVQLGESSFMSDPAIITLNDLTGTPAASPSH
ncbi:MAG TPA: glycosyl hydrolase [Steroidobacteraceae bacterium]|jgi:hypothetical protein